MNINKYIMSDKIASSVVNDKINGILVCKFMPNTESTKMGRTHEKYLATNEINPELMTFLKNGIKYKATGKIDGTSGIIRYNNETNKNEIYKRRDIKKDRQIPLSWIQTGSEKKDSEHLIGYMPLEKGDKWFIDCYIDKDHEKKVVNVITINDKKDGLCYKEVNIDSLNGKSVEIIGPKIQGNPHHLEKHCMIEHGLIELYDFPDIIKYQENILQIILEWFKNSSQAVYLEGVVLHLENGAMYKIHRHHLNIEWSKNKVLSEMPIEFIY